MAEFDMAGFIRTVLDGHVQPLTVVSVEPRESANSYTITLRLDAKQLAHLPAGLRAMLEPQCEEPLIVVAVWDEANKRMTLLIRTVRFVGSPSNRARALEIANEHNNTVGYVSRLSIIDRGNHMDAGLSVSQQVPLPEHSDISAQILLGTVLQLAMEAGNAATMLIANLERDASAPAH